MHSMWLNKCTEITKNKLRRASIDRLNDGHDNFIQQAEEMFRVDVDIGHAVNLIRIYLQTNYLTTETNIPIQALALNNL